MTHLDGGPVALALARRQEGCVPADVVCRVEGVLIACVAAQHRTRRSGQLHDGRCWNNVHKDGPAQLHIAKASCRLMADCKTDTRQRT